MLKAESWSASAVSACRCTVTQVQVCLFTCPINKPIRYVMLSSCTEPSCKYAFDWTVVCLDSFTCQLCTAAEWTSALIRQVMVLYVTLWSRRLSLCCLAADVSLAVGSGMNW